MVTGVQTQQRRGTAAAWSASGKILAAGEIGVTTDTKILKVGDGVNEWDDLPVAFEDLYLTIGGTATNSALLGGISSSGFVKTVDATTDATADKVAKRLGDGRLKAAAGLSTDDVANVAQMVAADSAAIVDARKELVSRDEAANFTLALADVGKMIRVNSTAYATSYNCTIPLNSSVAFPTGSWIDVCATDKGAAIVVPTGGVTYSGPTVVYGGGSVIRLLKTDTNTWRCVYVSYSPAPILRRKVKVGVGGQTLAIGFNTIRLDGADVAGPANNADTLGAGQQFDGTASISRCNARRSGWYDISAQVTLNEAITGRMYLRLKINGTNHPFGIGMSKDGLLDIGPRMSALVPLNNGDYVELEAFRENGATGTVVETNDSPSVFEWAWRRPL